MATQAGSSGITGIDLNCPLVHEDFCRAAGSVVRLHVASGRPSEASRLSAAAVRDFARLAETIK